MDETLWGLMNIVGPIILGVLLLWLVLKNRTRNRTPTETETTERTERATHEGYVAEEQRRRAGTDDL